MAERTRSLLSLTEISGSPTMVKLGRPVGDIHLDLDQAGVHSDNGAAEYFCQHVSFSGPPLEKVVFFPGQPTGRTMDEAGTIVTFF